MLGRSLVALFLLTPALAPGFEGSRETYTPVERRHWAFRPRIQPAIPKFAAPSERAWTGNSIDAFILAGLKKEGLAPAPPADRRMLIRRVTFDVTGLPPTPKEIQAFLNDTAPDAYEKVIDRLLASPHYGERWGQHWLDLVRFSETDGFEYDTHRPDAWRYRDYVIRSFNSDKPYDQFVREQLAGDEMDAQNQDFRVASGFNRLGPLRKNAGNQEVASSRNEVLTEMTNVTGSALLGVTLGCARCHDHKFDPIRQTDYYRMQAYFAGTHESNVPLASPEQQSEWKAKSDEVEKEIKALKASMKGLTGEEKAYMEKKIEAAESRMPEPLPALFSVADDPAKITPIHVLARGDYRNPGAAVGMRTLGVLLPDGAAEAPRETSAPRKQLADWILAPDHPLTARVAANRIWQYHFGRGIVATPNDFGRMGMRPSHPELLDYLANRLIELGSRWKPLHREILLSNTYRQSSHPGDPKLSLEKDPENALLSHFSRRRLDAEEIRDAALAAAGALNAKMGGPSVMIPIDPELVQELYKPSQWKVTPDVSEQYRRGVYLIAKRNLRLPFMELFDAPDMQLSCPRRESSTHAAQALELLNGDFTNGMAHGLAARLDREAPNNAARQVDLAYALAAGRTPTPRERAIAIEFLRTQPLSEFALAIFNLNAFLYID